MNNFTKKLSWLIMSMMLLVSSSVWAENQTGTITFGNKETDVRINAALVTGDDDLGNTWTITTEGTTSFTANKDYYQVGKKDEPATSITFTTTLPASQTMANISAKFGGFNGTAGTITIKVDDTEIGTGNLNGTNDVTVNSTSSVTGSVITITITDIEKGVKCYYISYGDKPSNEKTDPILSFSESTATATIGESFTPPTLTTNPTGLTITYTSSRTSVATVDQTTGAVTIKAVGETVITATSAETDNYNSATVSYTLTVQEIVTPSLDEIDLTGKTESIIFSDFSKAGSGYSTKIQGPFPASDGNAYSGWNKTDCSYNGDNHSLLQMKSSTGKLTSPTVQSDKGIQVIVTYGSAKGITLTIGEESITGEAGGNATTQETIVKLSSTETSTNFIISSGGNAAYVKSIEIVPLTGDELVAPIFSPESGTYSEAQSVTISCATAGVSIYYTTDGSDPTTSSKKYTGAITISKTTTLKAIASKNNVTSSVASATYTIVTPLTIAEARAQGTGDVFTSGIVTSCVGTTAYIQDETAGICVYGVKLTVGDKINVQGTLLNYNGLLEITNPTCSVVSSGNTVNPVVKTIAQIKEDNTLQGMLVKIEDATVTAISGQNTTIAQGENTIVVRGISQDVDYAVNDVISLTGNVGCFNQVQIANPTNVEVTHSQSPSYTLTITPNDHAEIFVFYNDPDKNWPDIQSGDDVVAGSEVMVSVSVDEESGYQIDGVTVTDENGDEVELTEEEDGISWTFTMPNSNVTVSCTCSLKVPVTYTLVTSTSALSAGDEIIIVNVENNMAMSTTQNKNNRGQVSLEDATWNLDKTIVDITQSDVQVVTLEASGDNWLFNVGNGYLYAASSDNNYLKTEDEPDSDGNAEASIEISDEGNATITFKGTNTRNTLRYNLSSRLFSCYTSSTNAQKPVQIYKKVSSVVNLKGDANGDGSVDISDVVVIVNYILNSGSASGNFVFENADVNNDGYVDISDVVGVVNLILNGE